MEVFSWQNLNPSPRRRHSTPPLPTVWLPFADYDDLKAQNADYASRIHAFEMSELKTRIAHEVGIPFDLSQRLTGENEDAIRKDAQSLAKLLKPQTPKSPPRSTEPAGGSSRRDALRAFTNNLMSKGE